MNLIFRYLGAKWSRFEFSVSDICPGHVTVPGQVVVNLNTVYSIHSIPFSLKNLLGCLKRSTV
jgi:hypothetical protein